MRINLIHVTKLALLIFSFSLISCKDGKKTVVEGQISGTKKVYVYLSSMDLIQSKLIDSVETDNSGKFKFKMHLKHPDFYQIFLSKNDFVILLLEPHEKVKLSAMANDLNNSYKISGSKGSGEVKFLTEKLNTSKSKLDSLEKIIDKAFGKPGFDTIYTRIVNQYVNIIKEQRNVSIKFIIENHHSLASIIALYQQLNDTSYVLNQNRDLQFVNIVADTLKKYYPEVSSVKILLADRTRLMKNYNILKFGQMQLNSKPVSFPDVTLTSIDKERVSLRQVKLKNKLVLINFWTPENEECLIVLKNFKELYTEFKAKGFEIYNIAITKDQQNWEDLIKSGNIAGINVIDKEGTSTNFYNVKNLPASYLIGLDENIIGKDLFGENLRSKLKELLK